MSHLHSRIECKECKKVIQSCRCMEAANNIEYVVCDVCKKNNPPQVNKGEGMREIANELWGVLSHMDEDIQGMTDKIHAIQAVLIEVAAQARREALSEAVEYCAKYREAYAEDIFPPRDMTILDARTVTISSGRMARFILDNCIKDLTALAAPDNGKETT